MTVYVTSFCYQIGGVVAIFCGILLAWFGTVFLRNRLNRDQLVLPAAALSVDLKTLEDVVVRLKPVATNVAIKIGDIQRALDEVFLETKGLPSPFQLPWSASANATAIEGYRQHLQQQRDWIAALQAIVHAGIERANLLRASHPAAPQLVLIDTTVSDLDQLAVGVTAPALDALRLAVAKRIDDLEVALTPSAPVPAPMPPQPRAQIVRTPEEIRLEIFRFGVASWVFLAFVTTIAGAYVLIFSSAGAGFGTPRDFVVCLLWGLGLPAGAQLMQSTTGTIATTFGVTK